jgi:hypothetical protein
MTDAEIDKAISEFESVGNHQYGWDALFRDSKTRKFWELVHPPGGGPRVLRPISAYDARLRYTAAFSRKVSEVHDYWLDGETLDSVTFVCDYWQLHFGNSTITPLTRVEVRSNGAVVRDGDDQFRNRLCEQMGKVVERFELERRVACTITFEDLSLISISGAGHFLTAIRADD